MRDILPINERAAQLPCQAMSGQNRTDYSYINSSKPVVKSVSKTNHAPLWEHESLNVPDILDIKKVFRRDKMMNIPIPGLGLFRICAELQLCILPCLNNLFDTHTEAIECFRKELNEWHVEHPEFCSVKLVDVIDSSLRCFCSELEALRLFDVSADIMTTWVEFIKQRPDLYEAVFTPENIELEE